MSLTRQEAIDDMQTMFKGAWDTTDLEAFYESVKKQRPGDTSSWASVYIRHASGSQRTMGGIGKRMFQRNGTVIISIFTLVGKGLSESNTLATLVTDAYEGLSSPNGVWFRNVTANEIGKESTFTQTNVLIEFEYTEIK